MSSNEFDRAISSERQMIVARGEELRPLATSQPLQVKDLTDRMLHVQAVIKSVMRKDVHYGVIPGTKKRSLLKEGSEILLATFHIAVDPEVEDLSTADVVRYRVRCVGRHIGTGNVVGFGLGACSSNEDKYKWRRPVCDEEFEETDPARRREKWFNGNPKPFKGKQVRTNPEEVANTILKMAKKRAQIDLTLTALAASDAFSEGALLPRDPPPATNGQGQGRGAPGPSASATQNVPTSRPDPGPTREKPGESPPRPATTSQLGLISKKLDQAGISETYYMATFEIGRMEELPFDKVDAALKWISGLEGGPP